jgi:pyridoxamine 5'-phosphate oxidase
VRIEGKAEKTTDEESSNYFKQRPRVSQLGAWASPNQSEIVESREAIDKLYEVLFVENFFILGNGKEV